MPHKSDIIAYIAVEGTANAQTCVYYTKCVRVMRCVHNERSLSHDASGSLVTKYVQASVHMVELSEMRGEGETCSKPALPREVDVMLAHVLADVVACVSATALAQIPVDIMPQVRGLHAETGPMPGQDLNKWGHLQALQWIRSNPGEFLIMCCRACASSDYTTNQDAWTHTQPFAAMQQAAKDSGLCGAFMANGVLTELVNPSQSPGLVFKKRQINSSGNAWVLSAELPLNKEIPLYIRVRGGKVQFTEECMSWTYPAAAATSMVLILQEF